MNRGSVAMVLLALAGGVFGCRQSERVPYERWVGDLTNLNAIARLDVPPTQMIGSYDRTGANEDYNHFQGKTKDGELILADLQGPGVVSRFWFTGIPADAKMKFFFDGETSPRLAFSWEDLRAGFPPFDTPPVSMDEQNCWYSYLPIPFRRRLLITTEDRGYSYGGSPKAYYQLNWQPLPPGESVSSLLLPLSANQRQLLVEAATVWERMAFGEIPKAESVLNVPAGQSVELWTGDGPATLQTFTLNPDLSAIPSALQRDHILREVVLQIYWDEQAEPSVNVPLGDFFGSVWQRWRAESMYFGSKGNTFFCRFPMPFQKGARIVLVNPTAISFPVRFGVATGPVIEGGYFHAAWQNSPASAVGRPHTVLQVDGRGRFAGCILSVVSADRSFWVLESDESMVIDGKKTWQGTGLEDYFNSGWYYGNAFARPLHGLPNKAPFRTVQYRLHPTDPVMFDRSFEMGFERGPEQKSRAAYESVAFYYLDRPRAASSALTERSAPVDAVQPYTLMTDLWNFERFGDIEGQRDYLARYREQFNPPFSPVLDLRDLALRRESGALGQDDFEMALAPFLESADASLRRQAEALRTLYCEPGAVLIHFYANMQSELYLDGERILTAGDPQRPSFTTVVLTPGRHVLAAASAWQSYPLWTQVAVRDAKGFRIGTDGGWRHSVNPSGMWMLADDDDSRWSGFHGYNARVKGPPEEPYVWVHPDPFVNTLSLAYGLRPSVPWPDKKGRVVYRRVFEIQ